VDDVELEQPRSERAWAKTRRKKNRRWGVSPHLLLAGGAVVFVVGSAWVGVWLAFATFPPATLLAPAPAPEARPARTATSLVRTSGARLQWRNPFPELKLALLASTGEPLATSVDNPGQTRLRIAPGAYRLRVAEPSGRWPGVEEPVSAAEGETLSLKPSLQSVAAFYLWRGKDLHARQKPRTAERAWRRAIHVYPDGVEARLELVELLTARRRYDEARNELREVLQRAPADERALRLEEALEAKATAASP
ncbi:MAG TPA: tetratricopeptide repeat protein, partial [Armatimonadota bacterium]|nr:tetratricopeptide repeat protein [Armatimonadota bacterium]